MKLLTIFIGILSLILLFALPIYLASSPERCASCHEMEPYYKSWKSSLHSVAARSCLECHLKPGISSRLSFALNYWREFLRQEGSPSTIYYPATENCTRQGCHSLNRLTSISNRIRINHLQHVSQLNISCSTCHPGTVHEGVGGIGSWKPAVEFCFECHGSESLSCDKCHIKPPVNDEFRHETVE